MFDQERVVASGAPDPVAPATDEPGSRQSQVTQLLRRISRAVQRATIYPDDHPAVRQAVDSLDEHLRPVLARHSLSVIVSRGRLLAAHGPGTPAAHDVPWLSARLHDRGIASLSLDAGLDREGTRRLVHWLAQPGEITQADDAEPIPAVRVTRFDYSRMRFREQPHAADAAVQSEAAFAWGAIANALAADWCVCRVPDGQAPDPDALADDIRSTIAANEGTGVADLGTRVVAQGSRLAELPEAVRSIVRQKLAAFVARLAPELRGQLLTVVPNDSPDKLNLLVELVDALPSHDMLEVVQGVDLNATGAPRQFVTLLRKMVALAASESDDGGSPSASGASRFGLATHNLLPGDGEVRGLLQQLFAHQAADAGYVPGSYQAHIEKLADTSARHETRVVNDLDDPCDRDLVSYRVNRVALHLLETSPASPGAAAFMRRLRDFAPRDLDAGRLGALGEVAAVVERLLASGDQDLSDETRRLAADYLVFCAQRPTVDAVLASIERAEGELDDRLMTVLRVGGIDAATIAIARLQRVADEPAREALALALARLPVATFSSAVVPALGDDAALARTLLAVLPRVDRERGQELAQSMTAHSSTDVRVRAFQLLFEVPLSTARFDRLLRQALDDEDPRVAGCGLQHAAARKPLAGYPALTAFLSAVRGTRFTPLQRHAVRLLRASATPEAGNALATALVARTRALDPPARQVSCAIEAALQEFGNDDTAAAARAWRRSAAGVCSWLLRDTREAS